MTRNFTGHMKCRFMGGLAEQSELAIEQQTSRWWEFGSIGWEVPNLFHIDDLPTVPTVVQLEAA